MRSPSLASRKGRQYSLIYQTDEVQSVKLKCDYELLHYLVALPFAVFSPAVISASIEIWAWIIRERPDIEVSLIMEINTAWNSTIRQSAGLFSSSMK